MSYLAMSAAPFNNDDYNYKNNKNIERKRDAHNQNNIKNKDVGTGVNVRTHVNAMINQIHKSTGLDTDVDNNSELGNFTPPPPPESAGGQRCKDREPLQTDNIESYSSTTNDMPVSLEGFDTLPSKSVEEYYKAHVPYYNTINTAPTTNGRDELLEKLNYMIHLLEEQQDEKTGHIMEEIILYSFLGIFIIFIVDSFARAGKYVR